MRASGITLAEVRARRRGILRILAVRGATNPRVFGSFARGTADAKSDVDLLVDLAEPRPRGFHYAGLIVELEDELARILGRSVHVTEFRGQSPDFTARASGRRSSVMDDRESRPLEYIQNCTALIEQDLASDARALADIRRASARSVRWSLGAIVQDDLPVRKAVVEAELAALRRDH